MTDENKTSNPSVRITRQAWVALKVASEEYDTTMIEVASDAICEQLSEFVEPEPSHEDQMDLFDGLESQ